MEMLLEAFPCCGRCRSCPLDVSFYLNEAVARNVRKLNKLIDGMWNLLEQQCCEAIIWEKYHRRRITFVHSTYLVVAVAELRLRTGCQLEETAGATETKTKIKFLIAIFLGNSRKLILSPVYNYRVQPSFRLFVPSGAKNDASVSPVAAGARGEYEKHMGVNQEILRSV